jgi:hypothetical protein
MTEIRLPRHLEELLKVLDQRIQFINSLFWNNKKSLEKSKKSICTSSFAPSILPLSYGCIA